jgi:hypothetical protein
MHGRLTCRNSPRNSLSRIRVIGGLFECQDLGTLELKGLPAPVSAWQVVSENRTLGLFEALRSGATPLVGRDEEMELLLRRWAQAKAGQGRVVLISEEPGVGKFRLAAALAERIAAEPHTRLRYFCSPHHQDNALYPVIAQMERAAGFAHADGPAAKVFKLKAARRHHGAVGGRGADRRPAFAATSRCRAAAEEGENVRGAPTSKAWRMRSPSSGNCTVTSISGNGFTSRAASQRCIRVATVPAPSRRHLRWRPTSSATRRRNCRPIHIMSGSM